jgi:hypothetical protein
MGQPDLNQADQRLVDKCLWAAIDGPYFPDDMFRILMGMERADLEVIAKSWPHVDLDETQERVAIIAAIGNLLNYPHGEEEALDGLLLKNADGIRRVLALMIGAAHPS